jgi:hypothetical protein
MVRQLRCLLYIEIETVSFDGAGALVRIKRTHN